MSLQVQTLKILQRAENPSMSFSDISDAFRERLGAEWVDFEYIKQGDTIIGGTYRIWGSLISKIETRSVIPTPDYEITHQHIGSGIPKNLIATPSHLLPGGLENVS